MARHLGVSPQAVGECKKGGRPVPIPWCPKVESVTGGEVTRKDLRPRDWQEIWPELATIESNSQSLKKQAKESP